MHILYNLYNKIFNRLLICSDLCYNMYTINEKENIKLMDNELDLDDIIYLTDENDNDIAFEFIDVIEYEDENYIALLPADSDSNDGNAVVILKMVEDIDGDYYDSIEDKELEDTLFEIFKKKFKNDFNF